MKKIFLICQLLLFLFIFTGDCLAATVIKKEDAALFSKKSVYADLGVQDIVVTKDNNEESTLKREDTVDRFSVVTATKEGNIYKNIWSNYVLEIDDQYLNANDIYDFNADGVKYDFGIYFKDYSRIAVYYTRLSKDLNVVAANFAPGMPVTDVVIAEETYKHVSLDVPYPYGIEKYDYYLRNIDGKLMVIELYWEEGQDISKKYIDKFEKA